MAFMGLIGSWLKGSGWIESLEEANVTTSGRAESLLHCGHVKRTRYAHQVTATALFALLKEAQSAYEEPSFQKFCAERNHLPQFKYWFMTLEKEILLLMFVRSLRKGDFSLYLDSMAKMAPWFFALDKVNYSRWLPVHIRDMENLEQEHPNVYENFARGKFVVHNSTKVFSGISIDHAHEQNNKLIKGDGGIIGITDNEKALERWLISGPHVAGLLSDFEESASYTKSSESKKHHEQTIAEEVRFKNDVKSLISTINEYGNPFLEESEDCLFVLNSGQIRSGLPVKNLEKIKDVGADNYKQYVTDRLLHTTVPLTDTIKRNKLYIFDAVKGPKKQTTQIRNLKSDVNLFSRLFIACQNREGKLEDFFQHENQSFPPALSQNNELRSGNKANLLKYFEAKVDSATMSDIPAADIMIIDGAALINGLPPIRGTTFKQYASDKFLPFLGQKLRDVKRLDVVFDVYVKDSLKSTARSHRGEGSRKRVKDNYIVPANWNSFLRHSDNKTELFSYLANFSHQNLKNGEKSFAITIGSEVLTLPPQDSSIISPCNHEEADSRMYLHLYDAIRRQNMQNAVIKTVDTDVMVLGVAAVVRIPNLKLYIAFGSGKTFRYINVNEVSQFLGLQRSLALPMFHSLTGCDTVSFLAGRGKKTVMDIWNSYEDLTEALLQVMNHPGTEINECFAIIEQFIVYLYDRGSTLESVNATRQMLFSHKNRTLENILPSQGALKQHILRASYQANIWNQMLSNLQVLPEPEMCGWEKVDEYWQPVWTTLPEVADAISILVKCNCKKGCKNACKCKKASLNCTAMCFCGGDCN
eukprot:gene14494-16001_t